MESSYMIRLNPNIAKTLKTGIKLVRGDKGIKLFFAVDELDTSDATAKIVFRRNNSTSVESDLEAGVDGIYEYTLQGNELACPGIVRADLKFYEGTTARVSTASFIFEVYEDTLDGMGTEAGSYSDRLEELTQQLQDSLEYYEDAFADTGALIAKGIYSASATYQPLNLVYYNGSSWVCRQECSGVAPAQGTYWQLLISGGGSTITVDDAMSLTSENPVQNKVITAAVNEKLGKITSGTAGNFASVKADGTLEDSGSNASDFTPIGHTSDVVASADGAHDFRYYEGSLQYKNNDSWANIPTGGSGGASIDDTTTALDKTWSSRKISEELSGKADADELHEIEPLEYSTSTTYAVGDLCMHEGSLYVCNTATSGAWNGSYWTKVRLGSMATLSYTVVSTF